MKYFYVPTPKLETRKWLAASVKFIWFLCTGNWTNRFILHRIEGKSKLEVHKEIERVKMDRPYGKDKYGRVISLRRWVFLYGGDSCYLCDRTIERTDRVEIDHDIPLHRWGYSIPNNLHKTHFACNQNKKAMTADEYKRYLRNGKRMYAPAIYS